MPRVIPFGDKILVKRRQIGEKAGSIYLPDTTAERPTDLADVVYVPDLTFEDREIIESAENIIRTLIERAKHGSIEAVDQMLKLNTFLKQKSIKIGDTIFMSKYVGIDYHETGSNENLTLVRLDDIIGVIIDEPEKSKVN